MNKQGDTMKLQKTKQEQFMVTLPKQIILALGWEKGQEINYKLDKGKLVLDKD